MFTFECVALKLVHLTNMNIVSASPVKIHTVQTLSCHYVNIQSFRAVHVVDVTVSIVTHSKSYFGSDIYF